MRGLLLVDGNGLGWWCCTRRGQGGPPETAVLFGMTKMLIDAQRQLGDYDVVVVFDGGHSALRTELFPGYKQNRSATAGRTQTLTSIVHCQEALRSIRANFLSVPGVEADDLISIIAARSRESGRRTIIWSDDRDLHQCLGGLVVQFMHQKRVTVTKEQALAEWGGDTERFIAWKALAGDSSDGIPGLAGIGEKRAHELVALCDGKLGNLLSERVKRVLEDKSWSKVLHEADVSTYLMTQYALVRTVTDVVELGGKADAVAVAIDKAMAIDPNIVGEEAWIEFVRAYDGFQLIGSESDFEQLYRIRIRR